MEPHKKNVRIRLKKKYYKYIFIILGCSILMIYIIGLCYYNNRFLPHTYINEKNVSGLTSTQVTEQYKESIHNHNLSLIFIDNQTEVIQMDECGIQYNSQNNIQTEVKKQNKWLWFINFFSSTEIKINNLVKVDETKLDNTIQQLTHMQSENIIDPIDAKVQYQDLSFSIEKEKNGTKINIDELKKMIVQAFEEGKNDININELGGYTLTQKTSDDHSLQNLLEAAKKYADASITYKTTTGNLVLDGNTIINWLSIDENGDYYKDEKEFKKQVTSFVKEKLMPLINTKGNSKTFIGANQRQVTVSGGNYGYKLNQDKEIEALYQDICDGKKETRTPITTGIQASYENGGLGNTFIEIDMTKQHFWLHKNGSIVLESDIVSGLPSDPNKKTPAGAYYLYFMQRDRILIGEIQADGKPEYETPVSYWMAFNGGIGLHDATWQPRFGGQVYKTKGSHGCINLPLNIAQKLYSLVEVNMPVVCYY